jgi:hypothetical protein
VKKALLAYKAKYKNLLAPRSFVIPQNDEREKDLWGVELGGVVNDIRGINGYYADKRPELEEMGFDFVYQNLRRWQRMKKALLACKRIYGDWELHKSFVVPEDSSWEPELWGMGLGRTVYDIRNSGYYKKYSDELIEIDFFPKPSEDTW